MADKITGTAREYCEHEKRAQLHREVTERGVDSAAPECDRQREQRGDSPSRIA
jgi:hypothetical protein